jgi:hypothetical protein
MTLAFAPDLGILALAYNRCGLKAFSSEVDAGSRKENASQTEGCWADSGHHRLKFGLELPIPQ